jgi:hypothetical protein
MALNGYYPGGVHDLPVKADEVFEYGDFVMCVDTEGYVEVGSNHANGMLAGVALEPVDATDLSSGDVKVRTDCSGCIVETTYGSGSLDATFIGDRVYVTGAKTVDAVGVGTNLVYAGKIVGIVPGSTTRCYVQLPPFSNAGIGITDPS